MSIKSHTPFVLFCGGGWIGVRVTYSPGPPGAPFAPAPLSGHRLRTSPHADGGKAGSTPPRECLQGLGGPVWQGHRGRGASSPVGLSAPRPLARLGLHVAGVSQAGQCSLQKSWNTSFVAPSLDGAQRERVLLQRQVHGPEHRTFQKRLSSPPACLFHSKLG